MSRQPRSSRLDRFRAVALGAALAVLVAACGPAATSPGPAATGASPGAATATPASKFSPEVQRLLAAAQAAGENELILSWSEDNLGGVDGARQWMELFNKMYGLNVSYTYTPGPGARETLERIVQESAAGQTAFTDVVRSSAQNIGRGIASGDLPPAMDGYDYTKLDPSRIPAEMVAPGGAFIEYVDEGTCVLYHSQKLSAAEVPVTIEQLLDPKWKGKVGIAPRIAQWLVYINPDWSEQETQETVAKMRDQASILPRPGDFERVLSGQIDVLWGSGGSEVVNAIASGAPLGCALNKDLPVFNSSYLGVGRTAAHPNLAKLWIHMILSEEGQAFHYELVNTDHHLLPGTRNTSGAEGAFTISARVIAELSDDTLDRANKMRDFMEGR